MTAEPITVENTKRGWSSFCRDERHDTCKTLNAKCSCACHGSNGQRPAAPAVRSNGTTLERVPAREASRDVLLPCPECGDTFKAASGLGRHRATRHGVPGQTARKAAPKFARTKPTAAPPARPIAHDDETAFDVATLVADPGAWHDIGVVELRAVPVDDRLVVRARFVR